MFEKWCRVKRPNGDLLRVRSQDYRIEVPMMASIHLPMKAHDHEGGLNVRLESSAVLGFFGVLQRTGRSCKEALK